ncbi:hypothetical protein [Leptolyngbya phage Lbo-JY46]
MIADKITIKQVPDLNADLTGLSKYKRSKMPGTFDWLQAAQTPDDRYITGLDENSMEINLIEDLIEREKVRESVLQLRKYLESRTGKDLSATSKFWEDFGVELRSDDDLVLNKINPMHNVMYHMLVANRYVAPSEEEAGDPKYHTCKYYAHLHDKVKKASVSTKKRKIKADAKLVEISEKGKDYMVLIGQYLEGKRFHNKLSPDDLFEMLGDYIKASEDNLDRFLKATEKTIEELQYKLTIDRAIRMKLIKHNSGIYQRGQVTLGNSLEEVYTNLKSPEYAVEFLSIKEEIDNK